MAKQAGTLNRVSGAKEITRGNKHGGLYGSLAWFGPRGLRLQVLTEQKYQCAACGQLGDHVDHIEPHRGDVALFCDRANLQVLCSVCHGHKTAAESAGRHHEWQAVNVGQGVGVNSALAGKI